MKLPALLIFIAVILAACTSGTGTKPEFEKTHNKHPVFSQEAKPDILKTYRLNNGMMMLTIDNYMGISDTLH